MEGKRRLCVVLLLCCWLGEVSAEGSSWTADVPSSVSSLQGSCVVIPCSFTYPPPQKESSKLTGLWMKESHEVIYHPDGSKVIQEFKGRTQLVGDLGRGKCSLRIDPLHQGDTGPFHFRIEIEDYDKYSFSINKVDIAVSNSTHPPSVWVAEEEVKVGGLVSASCSVFHSCPSDPPLLTWSHPGTPSVQSHQLTHGQWEVTSSLTFTPTRADHNQPLVCTAAFRGGKKAESSTSLNVRYAPVDVRVEGEASVKEGASVELRCSSDSNPAAHSYQWSSGSGAELSQTHTHTYTLERVSRHTEALYCTAINTEGQGRSSPLTLNVVYPPEIKMGSSCTTDLSTVTCLCMVESEPPSQVEWSLPNGTSNLTSTRVERHGSVTMVTLQRAIGFSDRVCCQAKNSQGNATLILMLPMKDKMLMVYIIIAVAALVVMVTSLTAWTLTRRCVRHRNDQPTASMRDMDTAKSAASEPSPPGKEPKAASDGMRANFYGNHDVYGNMEAEEECDYENMREDDAVYANM